MSGVNRKLVAVVGSVAVIASGALFASPAQAAMTCQSVPGQTIGADVKVGPVIQRVPAVANIKLCYGTGTAPVASVTTSGGTCTSNCLTVTVGGGDVDLEGASVSWTEDGVLKTQTLNPAPVDTPDGTCVISTGIPDAPNPNCFIAIGVDDPSGTLAPIVQTVNQAVTTALQYVDYGKSVTCSLIPDRSGYDFCTNPTGWTTAMADFAYTTACRQVPDQWDPNWGTYRDFCTDPVGWSNAVVNNAYQSTCSWIPPMYRGYPYYDYVYFCDDPVGWTYAALGVDNWCLKCTTIELEQLNQLLEEIRRMVNDNVQVQVS